MHRSAWLHGTPHAPRPPTQPAVCWCLRCCLRGKWWKVPLTLIALGAAAAGGYYGYKQYEEHRDKQDKKQGSGSKAATSKKK